MFQRLPKAPYIPSIFRILLSTQDSPISPLHTHIFLSKPMGHGPQVGLSQETKPNLPRGLEKKETGEEKQTDGSLSLAAVPARDLSNFHNLCEALEPSRLNRSRKKGSESIAPPESLWFRVNRWASMSCGCGFSMSVWL